MTARRVFQIALNTLALLALICAVAPIFAQDIPDEIENAKFQATGAINANAVFIRSGPSDNDYATMRLDKGAEITVVGERFTWLKVLPPEGSFCYVAKAYVNRTGNGSFGQVTSTLNVRTGSQLNDLKTKVAARLEPNQKVEIIGDKDEYYKIKPPVGVYFYVNKQFVDFVKLNPGGDELAAGGAAAAGAAGAKAGADAEVVITETPTKTTNEKVAGNEGSTTQPKTQEQAAANGPASQPVALDPEAEFDQLEKTYNEITQRPLDEQPVDALLADYQKLAASGTLPESLRRICEYKIGVLKTRSELKAQFTEVKKIQEDMKSKQLALRAEQQELQQRMNDAPQFYTAVGTLRTSSLQQGQQTMYRLTDPANGRTVVYLKSDDQKLANYIGRFIGVKGEVASDPNQPLVKWVTPSEYKEVEPAKLGQSFMTQMAPSSLMPGGEATATLGDQ